MESSNTSFYGLNGFTHPSGGSGTGTPLPIRDKTKKDIKVSYPVGDYIKGQVIPAGTTYQDIADKLFGNGGGTPPTPKIYTITFNPNGGSVSPTSKTTNTNGKLSSLPIPTHSDPDKVFVGWYTALTGGISVTVATEYNADTEIFAIWEDKPRYTITFDANGGSVTPTSATTGTDGKLTSLPTPTHTDSTLQFDGWFTDAVNGVVVTVNTVFSVDSIIYAHWKKVCFTITLNPQGGSVTPTTLITGTDGKLTSLPTPTHTNPLKEFTGWFIRSDGGAQITTNTTFNQDRTIYAIWEDKLIYTITFDPQGGSVTPTTLQTNPDGKLPYLPTPTHTDLFKEFVGWFIRSDGGTQITTDTAFKANRIIYAKWNDKPKWVVTFNPNGGSVTPTSAEVNSQGKLNSLPTPTHTDPYAVFQGWFTDTAAGTQITLDTVFGGNTIIYARWEVVLPDTYTITFDAAGGVVTPTSGQTDYDGKLAFLPTPTHTNQGKQFRGWYTEQNGAGIEVTTSTVFVADAIIYAYWVDKPRYTITFDPDGGSVTPTNGITGYDCKLASLPTPTHSNNGKEFKGWYTEKNGGGVEVTTATVFTADIIIYAYWTDKPRYTITFNANGGSVTPTSALTDYDGKLISLPTPTHSNTDKEFVGWYDEITGGIEITLDTVFSSDDEIYARWRDKPRYTITFDPNGGSVAPTSDITGTDGKLTSLPIPTHSNPDKQFDGWYTEATAGVQVTTDTVFSTDAIIYARWKDKPRYTITFNANGGSVTPTSGLTGTDGKLTSLPTPIHSDTNKQFKGWWTEQTGGVEVTLNTVFAANQTIYAKWEDKPIIKDPLVLSKTRWDAQIPKATIKEMRFVLKTEADYPGTGQMKQSGDGHIWSSYDTTNYIWTIYATEDTVYLLDSWQGMFENCQFITALDVSHFDTAGVTSFNSAFKNCDQLKVLHIETLDTSAVTNTTEMFAQSNMLQMIITSNSFVTTTITDSNNMFNNSESLIGGAGTIYRPVNPKDKTYAHGDGGDTNPGYFWNVDELDYLLLVPGEEFNNAFLPAVNAAAIAANGGSTVITQTITGNFGFLDFANRPTNLKELANNNVKALGQGQAFIGYTYDDTAKTFNVYLVSNNTSDKIRANPDCRKMFSLDDTIPGNLTIDIEWLNTSLVRNMELMFGIE